METDVDLVFQCNSCSSLFDKLDKFQEHSQNCKPNSSAKQSYSKHKKLTDEHKNVHRKVSAHGLKSKPKKKQKEKSSDSNGHPVSESSIHYRQQTHLHSVKLSSLSQVRNISTKWKLGSRLTNPFSKCSSRKNSSPSRHETSSAKTDPKLKSKSLIVDLNEKVPVCSKCSSIFVSNQSLKSHLPKCQSGKFSGDCVGDEHDGSENIGFNDKTFKSENSEYDIASKTQGDSDDDCLIIEKDSSPCEVDVIDVDNHNELDIHNKNGNPTSDVKLRESFSAEDGIMIKDDSRNNDDEGEEDLGVIIDKESCTSETDLDLRCYDCNDVFESFPELEEHIYNGCGYKPYKCGQCSQIFKHKSQVEEHVLSQVCLIFDTNSSVATSTDTQIQTNPPDHNIQDSTISDSYTVTKSNQVVDDNDVSTNIDSSTETDIYERSDEELSGIQLSPSSLPDAAQDPGKRGFSCDIEGCDRSYARSSLLSQHKKLCHAVPERGNTKRKHVPHKRRVNKQPSGDALKQKLHTKGNPSKSVSRNSSPSSEKKFQSSQNKRGQPVVMPNLMDSLEDRSSSFDTTRTKHQNMQDIQDNTVSGSSTDLCSMEIGNDVIGDNNLCVNLPLKTRRQLPAGRVQRKQRMQSSSSHSTRSSSLVVADQGGACNHVTLDKSPKAQRAKPKGSACVKQSIKQYKCKICHKNLIDKHLLKLHEEQVHKSLRIHVCPFCKTSFKQKVHLEQHVRLHTGECPYVCDVRGCGLGFVQLGALNRHKFTHQKPVIRDTVHIHQCTLCDRRFDTARGLVFHKKKTHASQKISGRSAARTSRESVTTPRKRGRPKILRKDLT